MRFFLSPARPNNADYLPLSQLPYEPTLPTPTSRSRASSIRLRLLVGALLATAAIGLFATSRLLVDYEDDFDDGFSLHQTFYLPFRVPRRAPQDSLSALQPAHALPASCLDHYFSFGIPCYVPETPRLDFVWTWVNGSDPLLLEAKEDARAQYSQDDPYRPVDSDNQERLYRDHDELRHSLRSVLAHFRTHMGTAYLLTSDFPVPATDPQLNFSRAADWRLGQVPQWLDLRQGAAGGWTDEDVTLKVVHHAEVFDDYNGTVFNSLAIESQLAHVQGVTDYFVYMNDDLYIPTDILPATFFTSAYGVVLHLDSSLMVPPSRPTQETPGEWRGMGESNYMLSERFGERYRPYVMHEAKIVARPLLLEAQAIWRAAFARSAAHPFRETAGPGDPADINTLFLHGHFLVERAREGMIWSWVVGRVGGVADEWGLGEARRAWEELGGVWEGEGPSAREVYVRSGYRETLEGGRVEETLRESGVDGLGKTMYVFSSLDGYAYATLGTWGAPFPSFLRDVYEEELPVCRIGYDECFAGYDSASEVFKNVAFRRPECGDCVISALVRASGRLGVSAFLPDAERTLGSIPGRLSSNTKLEDIPHLPLVERWVDGDFRLREVMRTGGRGRRSVRQWTEKLLERYRYVIGWTPSMFERLYNPEQAAETLRRVEENEEVALLCINDDVEEGAEEVAQLFRAWQEGRWGVPARWERYQKPRGGVLG
ncbi:uncharacterized protein LAESUDRAFT_641601 [Laetiporus sulphureus 93-53]|uniref:Stealth protein CR3 conserved region 3 domain-containing protein n=1 Tax=Laetiporus sulphureus 93-53 TaxID=1314785 RepID=A0A165HHT9_9APHY|nr:uncharacterized protein LAESUDRAFT_641601 [Laetiporus sulphureus 93-53]KZT11751.1 hypothetical protein LAESUDRAFT_641601 [Laetiporus sulphureus 93-53]